jgi:hypothetical protein
LNFGFEFLLRAEFEISPKDTAEENGNPNPQNICFHFPSPHFQFRITTLVERGRKFKINSFVEREISVYFENGFELGTIKTQTSKASAVRDSKA